MSAEYDLVIIGQSASCYWAAQQAAQQYARVAMVTQNSETTLGLLETLPSLLNSFPAFPSTQDTFQPTQESHTPLSLLASPTLFFKTLQRCCEQWQTLYSPAHLSQLGIDYIQGEGYFIGSKSRKPRFQVQGRQLKARSYLVGLERDFRSTVTPDSLALSYETLSSCWCRINQLTLNAAIIIAGDGPWSLLLSQGLARFGYAVTLICSESLLPREDSDAIFFLQCQLEADGVQVLNDCQIISHQEVCGKTELTTNYGCFNADLVIAPDSGSCSLASLQLECLDIDSTFEPLHVNKQLQTHHSNVYGAGAVLGGYDLPSLNQAEMEIALQNALYNTRHQIHYPQVPWTIPAPTPFSRVGFTEIQARQYFANIAAEIIGIQVTLPNLGLTVDESLLFCKCVVKVDGILLGAHVVGSAAPQVVEWIAIAIKTKKTIVQLPTFAPLHSQIRVLFETLAYRWRQAKHPRYRDQQEQFFRRQRKRHNFPG